MPFPRRLLNEGEELVLDLRPHWWFFSGPVALLIASLVVLVVARDAPGLATLAVVGVVLASLVWLLARYGRWATTNFVVTSDRLIYRSGVIAKKGVEIPLERVNTVFSNQSIWERMLRSGDLTIESGGERGSQNFTDIPHPSEVQNEIYKQIEANQNRMYGGMNQQQRAPDVVDQLDRLDDLRRRGVITEAEFQAKKAKLLDQI